jgi:hypothetical protein
MGFFIDYWPATFQLDAQVITMHGDSEEATLTPARPIAISTYPKLHSMLFTPSNH